MPPIPGSPTDETDGGDGISPILSGAPALRAGDNGRLAPPVMPETPASPSDDIIPAEHRRVPGLIPRSPLSPIRASFGFITAKRAVRRPVPPPIVVEAPQRGRFQKDDVSPGLESVAIASPPPLGGSKMRSARKTVFGWWDLGLLERMNTVRRKK
ncbi:hypothetical protein B0H67DRAFT_479777 [Lasiosphaeris hirsuta]|uniref:Uncharacterized protein n=1 Tax=Lasiosphaeris hirsuta TaxID=260670 RepID=A0AA40B0B0_9PEZI|nr:hypothetical protein B0H67DRAFT_479777 [Lasiosphaeris hirsuta]